MRALRRAAAVGAATAAAFGVLAGAAAAQPAAGAAATAAGPVRARVVVVAVPDLRWADLRDMPRLRAFADRAAVAELSVKTATGTPRCTDGTLTFSAGNRANADSEFEGCLLPAGALAVLRDEALHGRFDAHIGAFGDALHAAGMRTAAVGAQALPILADSDDRVDVQTTDLGAALRDADVVAVLDDELYYAPGDNRAAAAASLDDILGAQLARIPADTTVLVAGTSDGALTRMHLHALLVRGPGWPHRELRSPSTRAPYVQLRDLAPTVLSELGLPTPDTMVGRPAYATDRSVRSVAHYADDDDHAVTARDVGRRIRAILAELGLLVLVLLLLTRWWGSGATTATWVARFFVGAPVFTFAAQIVPWWRRGSWPFFALVAAGAVVVGLVVTLAARRGPAWAIVTGPGITAAILIADQFAGAPLQLAAPLGDNPIVAGRFHGMGNTDFALMCASMLICAGLAGAAMRARGRRAAAVVVASLLSLVAVVVDAAPMLGDDFGGVLAMVPASLVLVALVAGMRLTWQRVLAALGTAAVVAVVVALADYSRAAGSQTHVGRFVGQVLHGGAGEVVRRKLDASLLSFGNVALTSLVVIAAVVAIAARERLAARLRVVPGLSETLVPLVMLAVLGTFLNDSGVVVGGTVVMLVTFAWAAGGTLPAATRSGR